MNSKLLPAFIIFGLFCSLALGAFAQKQNVYFLKNNGKQVSTKDSADYIRILREPDSGSVYYNVLEFYKNGVHKLLGKSSKIEYNVLQGDCLTFYQNGKRKLYATYKDGVLINTAIQYFPNGNLYTVKKYAEVPKDHVYSINIQTANDSTGKALVVDGNGYYMGYDDKFEYIAEEGNLKAGLQDGDWKGSEIYKDHKLTFTEKYENGKFILGRSSQDGDSIKYTKREIQPEFKGGETRFTQFLIDHIRYPDYEKDRNIVGKVFIKFIVEKDGSLTDMEVLRDPSAGLTAEALRVLKLSPKWIPGYYFGRPVRVEYTVPINFSLQ